MDATTGEALQPGDLDLTFDGDGVVTTAIGPNHDRAWAVARQADGKLVAAGSWTNASFIREFALARYDIDGSLDPTFGGDGVLTTVVSSGDSEIVAVAVQPDGKIVAAGHALDSNTTYFAGVRYNADGSLDATFDGDGIVTTDSGGNYFGATAVVLQPDGKIVVAGSSSAPGGLTNDFALVRYNPDGSLDSTFDLDGIVRTDISGNSLDFVSALALQPDGKLVAAGPVTSSNEIAVVRYNPDGSLDTSFGGDGIVTDPLATGLLKPAMTLQRDGKIVVATQAHDGSGYDFVFLRFDVDGSLDVSFDADGRIFSDLGSSQEFATAIVQQGDDKLVAGGSSGNALALLRYNPDGSLDASFDGDGLMLSTAIPVAITALVLQPDGYLVAAGAGNGGSDLDFGLARFFVTECGNGMLDAGETCDVGMQTGAADSCCAPNCSYRPGSYTCRPAASACDVAETCSGSGAACPANAFAPSGTSCDDDICSSDACNGAGVCNRAPANAGVVCRAPAGPCDAPEQCDGSSLSCPSDVVALPGTPCRAAAGVCDVAEFCNGFDISCPPDARSTAVCRSSAGVCDVAESCNGVSVTCPPNGFASAGTDCRQAAGECDAAEACTGSQAACPGDQLAPDGAPCTPDGDDCTPDACAAGVCTHADSDGDAIGDLCDNCAAVPNVDQENADCSDPTFFVSGACAQTSPANRAGCCDGGDLCDACPAQQDNGKCDPQSTAAETVGPAGGTVATRDGSAELVIPPGALPGDVSISTTANGPATSFAIDRGPTTVVSFSMRPEGTQFAVPVSVTFGWDDRDGDGRVDLGTCVGGGDVGASCDGDADCASGDCTTGQGPDESALTLKRNGDRFSAAGFGTSSYRCDDHAAGACSTATAVCTDAPGTGRSSVAGCCDRLANTWTFQTCSFSEYFLGSNSGDLVPGAGNPATDCMSEWGVRNPLNEPWLDRKGVTSFKQQCRDGDATCDLDGLANGVCAVDVSVCLNVDDARLVHRRTGGPACTPTSVATWLLKKPRPDSVKPFEGTNAVALRDAVAGLAASGIGGPRQEVVTFTVPVSATDVCTAPVRVHVPLKSPTRKGQAVLRMQVQSGTVKDADKIVLRCLPPST